MNPLGKCNARDPNRPRMVISKISRRYLRNSISMCTQTNKTATSSGIKWAHLAFRISSSAIATACIFASCWLVTYFSFSSSLMWSKPPSLEMTLAELVKTKLFTPHALQHSSTLDTPTKKCTRKARAGEGEGGGGRLTETSVVFYRA